ncbi:MAG: hypothetical protein HXX09_14630 [Bacteroidetes bacterium]|nr:hypothetical protein [Bacteroidota bacterium]
MVRDNMINTQILIKLVSILTIIFSLSNSVFSQEKNDSLICKNAVKFDFVPLYYDIFDNRVQLRFGLEYEKYISKKYSLGCYLDIGLYDKYSFIKYYDFFNSNLGMYSIKQDVMIYGFHLLPEFNYYLYTSKRNSKRSFFVGAMLDFGFNKKNLDYFNSQTQSSSHDKYSQTNLGGGVSLGMKNYLGKHFFAELKTSGFIKIFNWVSEENRIPMISLDAQWTSKDYKYWWISNIKIGYAF